MSKEGVQRYLQANAERLDAKQRPARKTPPMPADLVSEVMALVKCAAANYGDRLYKNDPFEEVRARLTELLAGEPVAWTALDKFKDWFMTRNALMANEWSRLGHDVSPLFRSPAAATAALQARATELERALRLLVAQVDIGRSGDYSALQECQVMKVARAALAKEQQP